MQRQRADAQPAFVPVIAHPGGLALANFEPAVARQPLQGFAQRGASDAKLVWDGPLAASRPTETDRTRD